MQWSVKPKLVSSVTWRKVVWNNVKTIPWTLLTIRDWWLYPAGHQDDIEGTAIDAVSTGDDNLTHEKIECEYYPSHPMNLYEWNITRGRLEPEDVGQYFNIEDDIDQLVNYETKGEWRQMRLEKVLSRKKGLFSIPRNYYIVKGVPWEAWPAGKPWPEWPQGKQWPQWVPGPVWKKWPAGIQGPQWPKWPEWPTGKSWNQWPKGNEWKQWLPWPQWPKGEKGEKWEPWRWFERKGLRNSWVRYYPNEIVHHDWSARICIKECINKEPAREDQWEIFAKWAR